MNNSEFSPKQLAQDIQNDIISEVKLLKEENINPRLNAILIGSDESAKSYAVMKQKVGKRLGIDVQIDSFGDEIIYDDISGHIHRLNRDQNCHGIMIESPVLPSLDYGELIRIVNYKKDTDGLHPMNLGSILDRSNDTLLPATPQACIAILQELVETIEGLRITLVGHGRTVGAPLSDMLNNLGATVVCCNHFTGKENLVKECKNSNVIITATGVSGLITKEMVHSESIVIDAGIIGTDTGITGDTDYVEASKIAKYITPVPGGVGLITTSIIFRNLIKGIIKQIED